MTTAPPGDPGSARVEMRGESRDSSRFTQIGTQIIQPPLPEQAFRPWAELAAPAGLSNLPQPGLFVGRTGELARLDAAMAGPGEVVVQAVHGLGGIGKSTLAAHWAAAHASDYTLTWWITAATPSDIEAGLADLAVALQPALAGVLPLEALREGAVQWLAARPGWLLILDNVTHPADAAPLLARAPAGRYLITSRRATGWHNTAAPVRLDVLDPAQAIDLLAAILTQNRPQEVDGAAELCAELGYLPLAIDQAGAYLAQAGATPREYLDLLARYPAAMYKDAAESSDEDRTIARIWHVTLDRLADDPLPGQVLRILAWYAPEAIPRVLLDGLADPPALLHAVGRLAAYSMLTADAGTFAVHRLVQAVTRTAEPGDPHRSPQAIDDARDQATRQLADTVPDPQDPAGWSVWRKLLPHIEALTSHAPPGTDTEITGYLLNQAGLFLGNQGQPARAAGHLQRALASSVRVLGKDHPSTLASADNLAGAYRAAGDLGRAIPLYEQTLARRQRGLGADHRDTLTTRNNLANAYQTAGDLGRAIPLYEQTLADSVRILGADHPQTLTTGYNLAYAYQTAGDLGRAIPLYEQTLADSVRILGADHPQTLTTGYNLAYAYQTAGDLGRAIPLYEQTLADNVRILGADHGDTLTTRDNLAGAYQAAGDLGRAIPLYEQTLAGRQRVLGGDHRDTLATGDNLAGAYQAAGDLGRAIALYAQTLAGSVRVLGEDHRQLPGDQEIGQADQDARLAAQVPRIAHTLTGHDGDVLAVAFSPDGRLLATVGSDGTARLWDPATGEHLRTLTGHTNTVFGVAFSPDGQLLASSSADSTVSLWDPATGEHQRTLTGHTNTVFGVAFSPDGLLLASSSADSTVWLWDPATGEHQRTLARHGPAVYGVAFSPDGLLLATAPGGDGTARLWDPATGEQRRTLARHGGAVAGVAFSPDGQLLATAGTDGTARLWDLAIGELRRTLTGHTAVHGQAAVHGVAFSPDGRLLATAGTDGTARLWDPATGEYWRTLARHDGTVTGVAFSPDGRLLATASSDKTVRLWD